MVVMEMLILDKQEVLEILEILETVEILARIPRH